jgi:hypothetical protein
MHNRVELNCCAKDHIVLQSHVTSAHDFGVVLVIAVFLPASAILIPFIPSLDDIEFQIDFIQSETT